MSDTTAQIQPVFLDPSGRRWRRLRQTGTICGALAVIGVLYLGLGILVPPVLPDWQYAVGNGHAAPADSLHARSWRDRLQWRRHTRARTRLLAAVQPANAQPSGAARLPNGRTSPPRTPRAGRPINRATPIHAGFYVNWDDDAWQSLSRHVQQLDWVIAEWGFLRTTDLTLQMRPDQRVIDLLARQPEDRRPRLLTMITNVDSGGASFSGARVASLVATPAARTAFVHDVVAMVQRYRLAGVVIDFEMVPTSADRGVASLLRELRRTLHPLHAIVAVTVAADADVHTVRRWSRPSDMTIAMLYDQHSSQDDPGPVAAQSWYEERARRLLSVVPADHLLLAFGAFGYEWNDAVPSTRHPP